ncbi:unnamed protein product [Heterotrigona itama]|uniref:Uncharacterized protein n=1 Tax=Heterotrigona itama TaxID=395501 RepID=A0A6V7H091_9HYME|nr:unnamed protein product [Heterotrigona itama]
MRLEQYGKIEEICPTSGERLLCLRTQESNKKLTFHWILSHNPLPHYRYTRNNHPHRVLPKKKLVEQLRVDFKTLVQPQRRAANLQIKDRLDRNFHLALKITIASNEDYTSNNSFDDSILPSISPKDIDYCLIVRKVHRVIITFSVRRQIASDSENEHIFAAQIISEQRSHRLDKWFETDPTELKRFFRLIIWH